MPVNILAIDQNGEYKYLAAIREGCNILSEGRLKTVREDDFKEILLEADLTIVHPIFLKEEPFLNFVAEGDGSGFDLAIITKPHEYTDPVLTLALSCAKHCLLSLNSISQPLPKIRNPFDRDCRYHNEERTSKIQTIASFYTHNRGTRLTNIPKENHIFIEIKNQNYPGTHHNNNEVKAKPHYVNLERLMNELLLQDKTYNKNNDQENSSEINKRPVLRLKYNLSKSKDRGKFIHLGYRDSRNQERVILKINEDENDDNELLSDAESEPWV